MKLMMRLFLTLLVLSFSQYSLADRAKPRVLMQTSMGEIVLELDPEKAPKTVENFLRYVDEGFYDGTIFHRVIDGFMIQGGGFTADYEKKETHPPIINEADNGLRNTIGTIAMARTMEPHSATAQFFINVNNNAFLDFRDKTPRAWGYAVFGRVVEGMDTVANIKGVFTGPGGPFSKDAPQETVLIEKVTLISDAPSAKQE